jgi:hypothetical protein
MYNVSCCFPLTVEPSPHYTVFVHSLVSSLTMIQENIGESFRLYKLWYLLLLIKRPFLKFSYNGSLFHDEWDKSIFFEQSLHLSLINTNKGTTRHDEEHTWYSYESAECEKNICPRKSVLYQNGDDPEFSKYFINMKIKCM